MNDKERIEKLEKENISLLQKISEYEKKGEKNADERTELHHLNFEDLFDLVELQKLQDQFASAFNVASIITHPDGTPLTKPSNFCRLCNDIIRGTEKGRKNCYRSDSIIGKYSTSEPTVQKCMSGGLWDAGAAIVLEGKHIGNWLIGQIRDISMPEEEIRKYARKIGANENEAAKAFLEQPSLSIYEFKKIAELLFLLAKQLSDIAYQNYLKSEYIKAQRENIQFFQILDKLNTIIYRHTELNEQLFHILELMLETFQGSHAFFLFPCDSQRKEWDVPAVCSLNNDQGMFQKGIYKGAIPAVSLTMSELDSSHGAVEHYFDNISDELKELWKQYSVDSQLSAAISPGVGAPWMLGLQRINHPARWTEEEKKMFTEINRRITDLLTSQLMFRNVRENEKFLDDVFNNLPLMAFVKDAKTLRFLRFNKAGENMTGYPRNAFIGKNDYDFFPKEDADFFTAKDRKVLSNKQIENIPRETIHNAEGKKILLHTRKIPVLDDNEEPLYLLGLSENITDKVKTADELETTRKWLNSFMESTTEGISIYDANENLVICNEKAKSFFFQKISQNEIIGKSFNELTKYLPDAKRFSKLVRQIWETGIPFENEESITIDKEERWTNLKIFKIGEGLAMISSDTTEKRKLEKQLLQNQKIQSIGRLAGGVAHDYNNMLGIILGQTELALRNKDLKEKTKNHLLEIMKAAKCSAQLTRQLLAFARKQNIKPDILDINQTISGMLKMLKSLLGENIEIEWQAAEEKCLIEIDPGQLDQLIMNLCVNARDAIGKTGQIILRTELLFLDKSYSTVHPECTPGKYIVISVIDDGKGMDKKTQSMIFEPFYTTKELGQGTGLGLATVYGIIKQNNGFINVYSEPGQGTTMKIFFPEIASETNKPKEMIEDKDEGGDETIFVIEDDASVLRMTSMMLTSIGYQVISADSAKKALHMISKIDWNADLILSDIIMPEMNGRVLIEKIQKVNPAIKYMFMSGYTHDIITKHDVVKKGVHFIEKPFSRAVLARKIRKILDEPTK